MNREALLRQPAGVSVPEEQSLLHKGARDSGKVTSSNQLLTFIQQTPDWEAEATKTPD